MKPTASITRTEFGPFDATFGSDFQHIPLDTTIRLGAPVVDQETGRLDLELEVALDHPTKPDQAVQITLPKSAAMDLAEEITESLRQHPHHSE